jgi:arylamine N-acetyltransferase
MNLPSLYERYLRLLQIDDFPEGLSGLRQIVQQHLLRVPFENVSKLLLLDSEGSGRVTRLPEFLDGIERLDLGGTCYTNNPFLAGLLRALGYDADLLGADMDSPNVHTCVRVRIDSLAFHVDVGYAAPFRDPMRLDKLPNEISYGEVRWILERHHDREAYAMSVYSRGVKVHGYVVHEPPRTLDFFRPIILDSYRGGSTFTSSLRITRFFSDGLAELKGRTLTIHRGGVHSETEIRNMEDLQFAVANILAMRRCPIEKAVGIIERVTGKPFFAELE